MMFPRLLLRSRGHEFAIVYAHLLVSPFIQDLTPFSLLFRDYTGLGKRLFEKNVESLPFVAIRVN